MVRPLLASLAVLTLASCDFSSEPEYARRPGELVQSESSPITFPIPGDVRRGVPVDVTVVTQGGGCEEQGDTEVAVGDGGVEIRPFDRTRVSSRVCGAILKIFPHTVSVTFSEAGPAIIRAVGETVIDDGWGTRRETQVYELGIVVR